MNVGAGKREDRNPAPSTDSTSPLRRSHTASAFALALPLCAISSTTSVCTCVSNRNNPSTTTPPAWQSYEPPPLSIFFLHAVAAFVASSTSLKCNGSFRSTRGDLDGTRSKLIVPREKEIRRRIDTYRSKPKQRRFLCRTLAAVCAVSSVSFGGSR